MMAALSICAWSSPATGRGRGGGGGGAGGAGGGARVAIELPGFAAVDEPAELPEMPALVLALGRPETARLDELSRHSTQTLRLAQGSWT